MKAQPGAQLHAALRCEVTDQGAVTAAGDGCDLTDPPCRSRGPAEPQPAAPVSPQEELGQVAAAGPSAQGRDHSCGGPRRPPKRKARSSPQDSSPPRKRGPRRQH